MEILPEWAFVGLEKKRNKEREGEKRDWRRPLKHQKDNLRLKILWHLCLLVGLKGGDSVLFSAAGVGEE